MRKMWAVLLYPGGALICQKVWPQEVMNVPEAINRLGNGHPACIGLAHLYVLRCVREPARGWLDMARSRIGIVEDNTRFANGDGKEMP